MSNPHAFLAELEAIIDARLRERPEGSYVTRLADAGPRRIAQKVGEEGVEVALAVAAGDREQIISETADLVFHLMVALRSTQITVGEVCAALESRHAATSGQTPTH